MLAYDLVLCGSLFWAFDGKWRIDVCIFGKALEVSLLPNRRDQNPSAWYVRLQGKKDDLRWRCAGLVDIDITIDAPQNKWIDLDIRDVADVAMFLSRGPGPVQIESQLEGR